MAESVIKYVSNGCELKFVAHPFEKTVGLYQAPASGQFDEIVIPEEINGYIFTSIWERAFTGSFSCRRLVFPKHLRFIAEKAFDNISVQELKFQSESLIIKRSNTINNLKEIDVSNCLELKIPQYFLELDHLTIKKAFDLELSLYANV